MNGFFLHQTNRNSTFFFPERLRSNYVIIGVNGSNSEFRFGSGTEMVVMMVKQNDSPSLGRYVPINKTVKLG